MALKVFVSPRHELVSRQRAASQHDVLAFGWEGFDGIRDGTEP